MRTTNKLFKQLVQAHVLNEVVYNEEVETHKEDLQNVVDEFISWYTPYEQKRTPNKYEAFKDYSMGLPSNFNILFTHYDINLKLKEWFEKCGESYKQPKDETSLYLHLITRELIKLCKRYNVKF